jgi:hypothetical protein
MPGRMPAKNFRTILFDILTATAIYRAADEHIFFSNKSFNLILETNYTIKFKLMKTFVESAYKVGEIFKS